MTGRGDTRSSIEDRLPDWVAGRLSGAEAARVARVVEGDEELERDAELLRALRSAAPVPPEDLADRIVGAVREEDAATRRGRPAASGVDPVVPGEERWHLRGLGSGISVVAAAALVLVIGTVLVERGGPSSAAGNGVFDDLLGPSIGESSVVAGAPVLDDLSDEELTVLLEELEG